MTPGPDGDQQTDGQAMKNESSSLIHAGYLDNRVRGRVVGEIRFAGSDHPLRLDLKGDCLRDLAGCLIEFTCDPDSVPGPIDLPHGRQAGQVGEITASRRLVLPGPFSSETNCLFLEWFQPDGKRMAVIKPRARCQVSAPEWQMTEVEELEQKKRRWTLLQQRTRRDDPAWFEMAGVLGIAPPNLNESEWEDLLQEAEGEVDRLVDLFDLSDADPDWAGPLSRSLGWAPANRSEHPAGTGEAVTEPMPPQPGLAELARDASEFLQFLGSHFPADTLPDLACRKLVSRVAQVAAILETARESTGFLEDGDQTLLIALIKRALAGIHSALEQTVELDPNAWLTSGDARLIRERLFSLRESALSAASGLRSHG